jgi:hypothetical protein
MTVRALKEMAMAYLKVISMYWLAEPEENHENLSKQTTADNTNRTRTLDLHIKTQRDELFNDAV